MFGSWAGLFTVIAYSLMPGVVLSSGVISTDGVLFPFWALALYLFWRLREEDLNWPGVALLVQGGQHDPGSNHIAPCL